MAPRRSHGSHSGSHSSNYNSEWTYTSTLYGSGFTDGYAIAQVVFQAIFMIALIAIWIWTIMASRRGPVTRSVLKIPKFNVAITFAVVFIQLILSEARATVANVYFLLSVIISDSDYVANIFLVISAYSLIFHFLSPTADPQSSKRKILIAHYVYCGLLIALFIALFGVGINEVVLQVTRNQYTAASLRSGKIPTVYKLDVAFDALMLFSSIEIFVAAILIISKGRDADGSSKPASLFFGLTALPLIIRRAYILAYDVRYELGIAQHFANDSSVLALVIVAGICAVLTYAGIVAAASSLDKSRSSMSVGVEGTTALPEPGKENGYGYNGSTQPPQNPGQAYGYYGAQAPTSQQYPQQQQYQHPGGYAPGTESGPHGYTAYNPAMSSPPPQGQAPVHTAPTTAGTNF